MLEETMREGGGLGSPPRHGKGPGRAVPSGKWEGAPAQGGKSPPPGALSH